MSLSVAFQIGFEEVLQMTTESSEVKETLQRAQLITYTCVHAQLLSRVMDCSPPGSSVQGISQARMLEWEVISDLRGSS